MNHPFGIWIGKRSKNILSGNAIRANPAVSRPFATLPFSLQDVDEKVSTNIPDFEPSWQERMRKVIAYVK